MIDKEKHHAILLAILKEIYAIKEISSVLGFKGGTAAYLFYDLPRFSVDLDFDMLVYDEATEKEVFEKVGQIVQKYVRIRDKAIKHFTLYFAITYEEGHQRLKVEISRRLTSSRFEVRDYFGIPINVMVAEDVFTNKLLALTQRKTPMTRDVFDVHYFFKKLFPLNEKMIIEKSGKNLIDYLLDCVSHVEALDNSLIMHRLGELVDQDQKAWIKNHLKKDTITYLKLKIDILQREKKGNKLS